MREYINRLARGKFTYERPWLKADGSSLKENVTAGESTEFVLKITA